MKNYIFRSYIIFIIFATFSCKTSEINSSNSDSYVLEFFNNPLKIDLSAQSFIIEATTSLSEYNIVAKPIWVRETNSIEATKREFIPEENKYGERRGDIIFKKQNSSTESKFTIIQEGVSIYDELNTLITRNPGMPLSVNCVVTYSGEIFKNETIINMGVCYGHTKTPDLGNRHNILYSTDRPMSIYSYKYISNIKSLSPDKTYYFRSFLKTTHGVYYSEPVPYKTESIPRDNNFTPLRVILHVLHSGDGTTQNIKSEVIEDMYKYTNILFRGVYDKTYSTDLNVEFVLAEKTPSGEQLKEKGIMRYNIGGTGIIDGKDFLNSFDKYNQYMWDPEKYINIWLTDYGANTNLLGISTVASTAKQHPLDGLIATNWYATNKLNRMIGMSINSNRLLNYSELSTLAHEGGHYLGLLHVFGEDENDKASCDFDDYCTDTPNYNRNNYLIQVNELKFNRIKCNSTELFVSRNIMDYDVSYFSQYTPQQRARVQYVLNYGIFIPRNISKSVMYNITEPDDVEPPIILK